MLQEAATDRGNFWKLFSAYKVQPEMPQNMVKRMISDSAPWWRKWKRLFCKQFQLGWHCAFTFFLNTEQSLALWFECKT